MFLLLIGYITGILLILWNSILIKILVTSLSCIVIGIVAYLWRYSKLEFLLFSLGLLGGFANAYWHNSQYYRWQLAPSLISKNVMITGEIISISQQSKGSVTFIFKTQTFQCQKQTIHLHLSWYGRYPNLPLGSRWQLYVRLKPPHGLQNPGGFNYQQWLWINDIQATGYVAPKSHYKLLSTHQANFLQRWRQLIASTITDSVKQPELAAILCALTVGIRAGFTTPMWQTLQQTGTNHLVAIAGLHLGFLISMSFFAVKFILRFFPAILLYCPAIRVAALFSLLLALFYSALTGFAIPTLRALFMISLFMLGYLFDRSMASSKRLEFAAFIILLIHPFALWSANFWLSFIGVAWIQYGLLGSQTGDAEWRQLIKIQWILFLGLMPLTLFFFQQISLSTMVANAIAIPWIGFLIVPLGFVFSIFTLIDPAIGKFLFHYLAYLLQPVWIFLTFLAHYPQLSWQHILVNIWLLVFGLIGMVLLLAPKAWPGKWLGLFWLLPLCAYQLPSPKAGEMWLTILDVGQGLAVVIRTAQHTLIYDTGPKSFDGVFDSGKDIILPYLQQLVIKKIDMLVISHGDNDHSGGANAILTTLPVNKLLTSIPSRFKIPQAQYCSAGQAWKWDGISFHILAPPANQPYLDNDSSCVLQISVAGKTVLLPGDIEKPTEMALLKNTPQELHSALFIVPHHGSITSSTPQFVQQVHPEFVVFSTGYYNRFHFPNPIVMQRYQAVGSKLFNTADTGAITFKFNAKGEITVKTLKSLNKIAKMDYNGLHDKNLRMSSINDRKE